MITKKRIPLLINHHTHPSIFAALGNGLDISAFEAKDQALEALEKQTGDFTLVLGWNNSRYSFAQKELDRLAPLLICNVSFHQFLLNQPAREKFASGFPAVVENIHTPDWVERNLHQILKFIAATAGVTAKQLGAFYQELALQGVWAAEDKLLPGDKIIDLYQEAQCLERTCLWADLSSFEQMTATHKELIFGIKVFTDGAIGAKTAALIPPFATGEKGLLLYSLGELVQTLARIAEHQKPVSIHTIGDQSTQQVLSAIQTLAQKAAPLPPQIRLEHCQFIDLDMARQAKSMGIILSMQPNFSQDSVQYQERLPQGYPDRNNPFRMLIDRAGFLPGKDLLFGSDGPPHGVNAALEAALFPPLESQRLRLDEFVAGYCVAELDHGYIDVEIDEQNRTVTSTVHLKD